MSLAAVRSYFGKIVKQVDPKFHEHTSPTADSIPAQNFNKTYWVRIDSIDGVSINPMNITDNLQVTVKLFFDDPKAKQFEFNEAAWDLSHQIKLAACFHKNVAENYFIKGVQFVSTRSESISTNSSAFAISMNFQVRAVFSLIDEET